MTPPPGRVVLVGTPIGNLGDLTPRAAESLKNADVIFCEDTRRTRKLLSASSIPAPKLYALHQHNERTASQDALSLARAGSCVAVVSDAGMPGVSDPGSLVVRLAAEQGVPVEVLPGPSAFVLALVASGFPSDRFCFEGFLPRQGRDRKKRLERIAGEDRTVVLYESPHRVARTLADLVAVCGADRPAAFARELTKLHETVWRGTLGDAVSALGDSEPKGEWVLIVAGAGPAERPSDEQIVAEIGRRLSSGATRRAAIDQVAAELGVSRRRVYQLALDPPLG